MKLKPCPFCGSTAELKADVSKRTLEEALSLKNQIARCTKVTCYGHWFDCNAEEWNNRPLLTEALEALRVWVNHEKKSHGGIEIGEYNAYYDALGKAKAILAKHKEERE